MAKPNTRTVCGDCGGWFLPGTRTCSECGHRGRTPKLGGCEVNSNAIQNTGSLSEIMRWRRSLDRGVFRVPSGRYPALLRRNDGSLSLTDVDTGQVIGECPVGDWLVLGPTGFTSEHYDILGEGSPEEDPADADVDRVCSDDCACQKAEVGPVDSLETSQDLDGWCETEELIGTANVIRSVAAYMDRYEARAAFLMDVRDTGWLTELADAVEYGQVDLGARDVPAVLPADVGAVGTAFFEGARRKVVRLHLESSPMLSWMVSPTAEDRTRWVSSAELSGFIPIG